MIAYLSNRFPEMIESYVWEEIRELRNHHCDVLPCSIRRPARNAPLEWRDCTVYIFPLRLQFCIRATWICIAKLKLMADLVWRAFRGPGAFSRRARALAHTWLGAYVAVVLRNKNIQHIHVHHGYFASWVGMVAARLLKAKFSFTLHGSDLLVSPAYLDSKLQNCDFCITVSEYNLRYIQSHYPQSDLRKVIVRRLGIDLGIWRPRASHRTRERFLILSVGRLHPVKNHTFLVSACLEMKRRGVPFHCVVAGEGGERRRLEQLIRVSRLTCEVELRGHVPRGSLPDVYADADVVVLTSLSEGLPVTLMEAMAMQRVVLAPQITGIPEIVRDGFCGFLYKPNSLEDFVEKLCLIQTRIHSLDNVREAARREVETRFNSRLNLTQFAEIFLRFTGKRPGLLERVETSHENSLLQQI